MHYRLSADAVFVFDILLFGFGRMHKQHINIAALAEFQRFAGAGDDNAHAALTFFFKKRNQRCQQTGIVKRGCRRDTQNVVAIGKSGGGNCA